MSYSCLSIHQSRISSRCLSYYVRYRSSFLIGDYKLSTNQNKTGIKIKNILILRKKIDLFIGYLVFI